MWNHGLFLLALLSMVFAIGGVSWFFEGIALLRIKRLIEKLPPSEMHSIALGLVEVKGKAKWEEKLYSPISETPCVYYTYRVEQWQHKQDGSTWVPIALGESGERCFYVEDNTGRVLVDPVNAKISSPANDVRKYSDYSSLPQNLKSLLDKESNQLLRLMRRSIGELMFTENYIRTDHEIYILGTAEYKEDVFRKSISREEKEEDKIVIRQGKEIPVFYISDRSEKEITRKMAWSSIRRMVGGPITLGVCLFLIYHYYSFSLKYISRSLEISLLFKGWILIGPMLAVIIVFFLGYRYYDFTKVLIRSQGN
ncbi:GIDE domain-containing protein [Thermodesulfobacteriota bacterium]